jgi:hypothetical protein
MAAGCDSYCGTGTAGEKAGAIAGTMALGAVVGVGIDALFGRERIVYRGRDTASAVQVVPIVDSRKTAVRVTIGF